MRALWLLIPVIVGVLFAVLPRSQPPSEPASPLPLVQKPQYRVRALPQAVVHILVIPAQSRFEVTAAVSQNLATPENLARKHQAIAALNGGFFDPENQKSTSYVVLQGKLVADPRLNERIMNNPDLAPYLDQILNRTEFRRYRCGQTLRYDITRHQEPPPSGCQIVDAVGGGPRLLPELTLIQESFVSSSPQAPRDPLRSNQPNARTAVGLTHNGDVIWVLVAQRPEASTTSGMSLPALAALMKTLSAEHAMSLDGGSSAALYYKGETFYGRVNDQGKRVRRPVKSVLLLQAHETL